MYFFCVGSIDSGKIVLTPGATEKDLNFCWYSKTKRLVKVKLGKKEESVVSGNGYSGNNK